MTGTDAPDTARALALALTVRRGEFELSVDLSLPGRGVTGIIGPSGSGKTSLLRAVAGLDAAPGGRVRLGTQVWQEGAQTLPPHRRRVGYVFQEAALFEHLSVRGNIDYGWRRLPAAERRLSPEALIERLGLSPLLGRPVSALSGGERQRVALARALAASPELLLMDEPLASLDPENKRHLLPYLEALPDYLDCPVLYVSHSPEEVARLADYLVMMEAGRVRAEGPLQGLLTRSDLPPAQAEDAASVLHGRLDRHDPAYGLSTVTLPEGEITLPRVERHPGEPVRLRVAARDLSLALAPITGTSILNCLPVRVEEIAPYDASRVTVRLSCGDQPLLARVTRKSADQLGLKDGMALYAQIKTAALL